MAGICLRGLAGWGDNMAALDTVVNTFGGEWFNMNWQPQLTSPAFEQATNFYVNLVRKYGEPGASNDSFNQLLTLYGQGKCAMWYDATVAATSIATDLPVRLRADRATPSRRWTRPSPPAGCGPGRWASRRARPTQSAAWKFVSWATSKQYDSLVASEVRLGGGPAGHQDLAVQQPELPEGGQARSPTSPCSRSTATDPDHPTVNPVPYVGVQYVDIPQFESLGVTVGQQIAGAIAGTEIGEPGAADQPVRRLAVHPGGTVGRLALR